MKPKVRLVHLIPFLLALLASPLIAQTEQQKKDKDLPNFHQVNEHLYRGAQPTIDGVLKLSKLGIKTILSLRGEGKLSTDEAKAALDAGIHYLSVPMPDFGRPKDEQVETALGIINDPQNWPVFVHCKHGEDRTGVVIACYRISNEGKTGEEALKEAKQFGMSMFQRGMKDFIGDYYKRKVSPIPKSVLRRVSDGVTLARSFKAGYAAPQSILVASATVDARVYFCSRVLSTSQAYDDNLPMNHANR